MYRRKARKALKEIKAGIKDFKELSDNDKKEVSKLVEKLLEYFK